MKIKDMTNEAVRLMGSMNNMNESQRDVVSHMWQMTSEICKRLDRLHDGDVEEDIEEPPKKATWYGLLSWRP
jgi:hypothetical protein